MQRRLGNELVQVLRPGFRNYLCLWVEFTVLSFQIYSLSSLWPLNSRLYGDGGLSSPSLSHTGSFLAQSSLGRGQEHLAPHPVSEEKESDTSSYSSHTSCPDPSAPSAVSLLNVRALSPPLLPAFLAASVDWGRCPCPCLPVCHLMSPACPPAVTFSLKEINLLLAPLSSAATPLSFLLHNKTSSFLPRPGQPTPSE